MVEVYYVDSFTLTISWLSGNTAKGYLAHVFCFYKSAPSCYKRDHHMIHFF